MSQRICFNSVHFTAITFFCFSPPDDVSTLGQCCLSTSEAQKNKKLTNPGSPAAHPEPAYRCFLPDLTGFTGPWLRRTRAYERAVHQCVNYPNYWAVIMNMAERVGFEPTLGYPKHAFQACAFSRSATSPFSELGLNHLGVSSRFNNYHKLLYGGEGGI